MISNSKQVWSVGSKVNIGFMKGLEVLKAIPTPGDFFPDAYILHKDAKYYEFVPHRGIVRIDTHVALELLDSNDAHKIHRGN